ncbi:hypothetical protein BANRA_05737 [Klebsiella pneumoniae]|nr:hypothetical protein BANRA_05737 [Klebsiella pneumoniae]
MSMKMGDLAKRPAAEAAAPKSNTRCACPSTRPSNTWQEKIKSRTMSLEDEYFRLLEMMKFIPRFESSPVLM